MQEFANAHNSNRGLLETMEFGVRYEAAANTPDEWWVWAYRKVDRSRVRLLARFDSKDGAIDGLRAIEGMLSGDSILSPHVNTWAVEDAYTFLPESGWCFWDGVKGSNLPAVLLPADGKLRVYCKGQVWTWELATLFRDLLRDVGIPGEVNRSLGQFIGLPKNPSPNEVRMAGGSSWRWDAPREVWVRGGGSQSAEEHQDELLKRAAERLVKARPRFNRGPWEV